MTVPDPTAAAEPQSIQSWIEESIARRGGYPAAILADLKAAQARIAELEADAATLAKVREIAGELKAMNVWQMGVDADDSEDPAPAAAFYKIDDAIDRLQSLLAPAPTEQQEGVKP